MNSATRSFLWAMLVGGLAIFWLTLVPFGRAAGYGNSGSCLSVLTNSPPAHVNSLIIGSSRARRGIEPERLESQLGLAPSSFANLGHPAMSPGYDYATIDRLSRNRKLDYVLVEVRPYGPAARKIENELDPAPSSEIRLVGGDLDSLFLISTGYREQMALAVRLADSPLAAGWNIVQLFVQRMGMQVSLFVRPKFLKGLAVDALGHRQSEIDGGHDGRNTICFLKKWSSPGHEAQHGDKNARALRSAFERYFSDESKSANLAPLSFFDANEVASDRTVIDEIARLGRERDFQPVFFYLPSVRFPTWDRTVVPAFERRFGAPLLLPDDALRARLEHGGYWDNGHLNNQGRALFTDWVASQMTSRGLAGR